MESLTPTDRVLLEAVQRDSRTTTNELGALVNLSHSPVWRRLKKFEEDGLIRGYHASLDRRMLGYDVLAFVSIRIDKHDEETAIRFAAAVQATPEIVLCHAVSGPDDFILLVLSKSLDHYASVLTQKLRQLPGVAGLHSSFSLTEIKDQTSLRFALVDG